MDSMKDIISRLAKRQAEIRDRIGVSILIDYYAKWPELDWVSKNVSFSSGRHTDVVELKVNGKVLAEITKPAFFLANEYERSPAVHFGVELFMQIELLYRKSNDVEIISSQEYDEWVKKEKERLNVE